MVEVGVEVGVGVEVEVEVGVEVVVEVEVEVEVVVGVEVEVEVVVVMAALIPMLLNCPECNEPHIDKDEWGTKPHRTHLCSWCSYQWRPANVPTVGVAELPSESPKEN